jgi:beta-xylosidase
MRRSPLFARFCLIFVTLGAARASDWYLFTSFRGNGEDGVHFALSPDGYHWEALAGDRSFLKPAHPGELTRDPFLTRGPDGIYHMIWTWGWYRDPNGLRLGHATSRDLVQWTEEAPIPVMGNEPKARNAWAPEMSWDSRNGNWIIYWATTIPGRFPATDGEGDNALNHRIYSVTTRDFREYSPARVFFDPGFNVIDTTVLEADGRFILFLKDERRNPLEKNLRMAFAKEVAGPYTGLTEPFTESWVEGPTAIKIGSDCIVYFDHYQKPQHYGAMRSRDLKTWEDVTAQMSFPAGQRHGTVIRITEDEAMRLRR